MIDFHFLSMMDMTCWSKFFHLSFSNTLIFWIRWRVFSLFFLFPPFLLLFVFFVLFLFFLLFFLFFFLLLFLIIFVLPLQLEFFPPFIFLLLFFIVLFFSFLPFSIHGILHILGSDTFVEISLLLPLVDDILFRQQLPAFACISNYLLDNVDSDIILYLFSLKDLYHVCIISENNCLEKV